MATTPTLVFVPGAWHKPSCYDEIIKPLENDHHVRCVRVTLPSTTNDPDATFKNDLDAARDAIISETQNGRDVIVVAHSYGGIVGSSAIQGLAQSSRASPSALGHDATDSTPQQGSSRQGYIKASILIASGFNVPGLAFMDPFFGRPPPQWRADLDTGYATLVVDPRRFFYHDLPSDQAEYWASQLTTQSLKALYEGREFTYAGWRDVPTWYIGTTEDQGLPLVVQRASVGMARGQGAIVHHRELESSHSPFLSMPGEVVEIVMEAVDAVGAQGRGGESTSGAATSIKRNSARWAVPEISLIGPTTWFRFGIPFVIGRLLGWVMTGLAAWKRRSRN